MDLYTLKISIRNIVRDWQANCGNILSLVLGLACFIIIFIHIHSELTYDQHHQNAARIYRLNIEQQTDDGGIDTYAISPGGWAHEIQTSFSKIEKTVRIYKSRIEVIVDNSERKFYEKDFYWADPELLSVFSFRLINGTYTNVLDQPNALVISERASRKYFGDENPVGKFIRYTDTEGKCELTITGVFSNAPSNIHFRPEFIGNIASLKNKIKNGTEDLLESNEDKLVHTYFLLSKGVNRAELESEIQSFIKKRTEKNSKLTPRLEPLSDIHFSAGTKWQFEPSGQMSRIYLLSFISGLILLVAIINFISLASAQAEIKIKGIDTRKILGATRLNLMVASWTEAFILAFVSIILSLLLIELLLPTINGYLQKDYALIFFDEGSHLVYIIVITFFIAFIVGSYPAIVSTRANHVNSGSGRKWPKRGVSLRHVLVTLQFGISSLLIISTVLIDQQLNFVQNRDLGFSQDLVLNVLTRGEETGVNFQRFKNQILNQRDVLSVSGSFHQPFESVWNDLNFKSVSRGDKSFLCDQFNASDGFVETFEIQVLSGRNFTASDTGKFLMNEAAVKSLGISNQEAIGMEIEDVDIFHSPGKVIGVVKDFHYQSLHSSVKPLVIWHMPYWPNYMSIKISSHAPIHQTISLIEKSWKEINPQTPFSYSFLDQDLSRLYLQEQILNSIFKLLTGIAIFIACIGLFALSKISIQRRIKEMGIRKVLGAGVWQLMYLLWKEYILLIFIAVLVFSPLTYLTMFNWLQKFAYHIEIHVDVFIAVSAGLLALSLITVSYQIGKAAIKNPTEALRHN